MDDIIEPNSTFDFTKLSLGQPAAIQGGAYFTKILYNSKPLYIQTPKSSTKQGFIKNAKKIYCDLMFDTNDEEFITWMENLESTCHSLIFEKSEAWFQNSLELNDVTPTAPRGDIKEVLLIPPPIPTPLTAYVVIGMLLYL